MANMVYMINMEGHKTMIRPGSRSLPPCSRDGGWKAHEVVDPVLKSRQVVLMTGRSDLLTPRKGMEEEADDFLEKPFSLQALLSCLKARFSRDSLNWLREEQVAA
jgi:FixJ family two-component response regulator